MTKKNIEIKLPDGVRDIIGEEAVRLGKIEADIIKLFSEESFSRVITPLVENFDVLGIGLSKELKDKTVKFIDPQSGTVTAVRPDITPQVARLVATRFDSEDLPLKLFYNESVLRYEGKESLKTKEIFQIGVEYVSTKQSTTIDCEVIELAIETLKTAGLKDFKIDIGDAGFVKEFLGSLNLKTSDEEEVKSLLAIKDKSAIEAKAKELKLNDGDAKLLTALTTFYGEEEVIEKAASLTDNKSLQDRLNYLKELLSKLKAAGLEDYITVDLGEVRGLIYYTGIIFEAFSKNSGKPLLTGGRYDALLKGYGLNAASTGFAIDIETLTKALK